MTTTDQDGQLSGLRRVGEWLLKCLSFFVILEPIWMLLPFAGFLYGSVLQIENLARNPKTAWLTHFVFPVLTLGWLGPILVLVGLALFLIGAGQIYWAKFRRSGLVTTGLYRFVRHPQYVALTLFGGGILLTWGRAITFLAFFLMMFLYYYLAKSEERICDRLFGTAYSDYRARTSFIFPGDKFLRPLRALLPSIHVPAPLRVAGAFAVATAACFGLMWLIHVIKVAGRTVPYLTADIQFKQSAASVDVAGISAGLSDGVPFVQAGRVAVVRGPYRSAAASGFAERVLQRLGQSAALKSFLAFLDEPEGDVAIVFCAPLDMPSSPGKPGMLAGGAANGRGPAPDPAGPDRVRLVILRCRLSTGAQMADAFADKSKRKIIAGCIAPINLGKPETEDLVDGDILRPGPGFPGEERWDFLRSQLAAARAAAPATSAMVTVPGAAPNATLVLVKAPILRTRLDAAFAQEILDRLVASPQFRDRLQASGAGGKVVPVAFPRPGPNWYRAHHDQPQISVFVILAHLGAGKPIDDLFRTSERELLGAFIADMDFKIAQTEDSVTQCTIIGPRRDLDERWRFFLSGLGY